MEIETAERENNDTPRDTNRSSQTDTAIIAMLRELLVEQREVIARLVKHQQSTGTPGPTDPGPATELIEQYRRIQRALALTD